MALMKVHFEFEQDEDGYPPVAVESVWCEPTSIRGEFIVDSIPFFIRDATLGDVVEATERPDGWWFARIVRPSTHSLIRAVLFDTQQAQRIRTELKRLGCSTEYLDTYRLIAVHVPGSTLLGSVQAYLDLEAQGGTIDYEEPLLRG